MKLTELEPKLYKYIGDQRFKTVKTVDKADSVMFLCPVCFKTNKGNKGTHSIRVDFKGKGVPVEIAIKNAQGEAVYWNATGKDINDLTLTPSILLLSGCAWHGFVTAGEVI